MAWTQEPGVRVDLPIEGMITLDGSGAYTGDWLDSTGVNRLRIAVLAHNAGAGTFILEEGQFDKHASGSSTPRVVRSQSVTLASSKAYQEFDLTTRFYRVKFAGGSSNDYLSINARVVG